MLLTLASLKGIEDMLRDSLDALEVHGDTVWDNEQRLRPRELALRQETMAGERKRQTSNGPAADPLKRRRCRR